VLKKPFNKAAGEKTPEAYILKYVEEVFEPRTRLKGFFSTLLCLLYGVRYQATAMATLLKSFPSSTS